MIRTSHSPRSAITGHWWIPLVRGLLAIAFGVSAVIFTLSSLVAFVIVFGAFAFANGAFAIVGALRYAHPERGRWWAMLVQGVVGIGAGLVAFLSPGIALSALAFLIAFWAIVTGVLEIVSAIRVRRDIAGELFLFAAGGLSILVGVLFLFSPFAALVTFVYVVAFYAIVAGIALVALAFKLRSLHGAPPPEPPLPA